ncbi:MAG: hypothetical protein IJ435_07740 [Clostridia bacterium]|nr:hypothetical protein [Clostridia bacterium]
MHKRIFSMLLVMILAFSSVQIEAAGLVNDMMTDLSREAQHFYDTQVAMANMTVSRPAEDAYVVAYVDQSGKTLTTQLCRTDWGTWNLGDMKLYDGYTEKTVISGATDWEYVFRVYNPISQALEFMGGNHGSERLNSIVFKEGVTGETFSLEVGESRYVARLVVEENTTIHIPKVDYLDFANVKRVYTIVGGTVNLDCEVSFIRDIKMSLSYTAMAPVNKDFSRYCFLGNEGYVITEAKGAASKKYLGNMPVTFCRLSGDDPSASVEVGIYNEKDMTDNFSNRDKTFIWDMSEEFNKVYFSKYDMSNLTKITAGTVWDFGTYWKVKIQ